MALHARHRSVTSTTDGVGCDRVRGHRLPIWEQQLQSSPLVPINNPTVPLVYAPATVPLESANNPHHQEPIYVVRRHHPDQWPQSTSLDATTNTQSSFDFRQGLNFRQDLMNRLRFIDRLPQRQYSGSASYLESEDCHARCLICLCHYVTDEYLTYLPCFHLFHTDCVSPWLLRHTTCPICRLEVFSEIVSGDSDFDRRTSNLTTTEISEEPTSIESRTFIDVSVSDRSRVTIPGSHPAHSVDLNAAEMNRESISSPWDVEDGITLQRECPANYPRMERCYRHVSDSHNLEPSTGSLYHGPNSSIDPRSCGLNIATADSETRVGTASQPSDEREDDPSRVSQLDSGSLASMPTSNGPVIAVNDEQLRSANGVATSERMQLATERAVRALRSVIRSVDFNVPQRSVMPLILEASRALYDYAWCYVSDAPAESGAVSRALA